MKKIFKIVALATNLSLMAGMISFGSYQVRAEEAKESLTRFTSEERYCLQQNIYFEARNQSTLGQVSVAWVTLNRMDSNKFPSTICKVVWQKKQFSWTHDGKKDRPGKSEAEQLAWTMASHVVEAVLQDYVWGRKSDAVGGALFYHADYVKPIWRHSLIKVATIENHIFYEDKL